MALTSTPEQIAEWLSSMSSCVSQRSLNRLKQEVTSRRVTGRDFTVMVNECRLCEIVGEDITGRDAARLRKAWHSDFPDSLNIKGQNADSPVSPPSGARGNPVVTQRTQPASQSIKQDERSPPPPQVQQSGRRTRMTSGDGSYAAEHVAQSGCCTSTIAMMFDRLARWAGFDRFAAFEEVRDLLSEVVQDELRLVFLDMPAMSPRAGGFRGMGHNPNGDSIHASLQMELERVKMESAAHRAQAQMATQQAEFDRIQAQASMQKVQLELERVQLEASSQQVQAARERVLGFGSPSSPRPDVSPRRQDSSPSTSNASPVAVGQVRKQEYERQEEILHEQQRQLEAQRREFEHEKLIKQQQQAQRDLEQQQERQRGEDAAAGRAGWAVVEGVYSDPASAALAAAAVHSPSSRQDPQRVATFDPSTEDRPEEVPNGRSAVDTSPAFKPRCEPIDTSGHDPSEIAEWIRSLPDSQVPEAQRKALAETIEERHIYGAQFTDLAGKSAILVEYGLSSPQQAVKVRKAWEQVLREDEFKQVAYENATQAPSPKGLKLLL